MRLLAASPVTIATEMTAATWHHQFGQGIKAQTQSLLAALIPITLMHIWQPRRCPATCNWAVSRSSFDNQRQLCSSANIFLADKNIADQHRGSSTPSPTTDRSPCCRLATHTEESPQQPLSSRAPPQINIYPSKVTGGHLPATDLQQQLNANKAGLHPISSVLPDNEINPRVVTVKATWKKQTNLLRPDRAGRGAG